MHDLGTEVLEAAVLGLLLWIVVWAPGGLYLAIRRRGRGGLGWLRRTAPVALFFGVYSIIRMDSSAMSPTGVPLQNARHLVGVERALHIWWEPTLSNFSFPGAHYYYDYSHFLLTILVVNWVGVARPQLWKLARNAFLLLNSIALSVFFAWPTDPPRLLPSTYGIHGHALGTIGAAAAQFASFPSLHVGYAVWVALVVAASTRFRRLGWVHVVITSVVVVVTGNHYVLDVVAGAALCLGCWLVSDRLSRRSSAASPPVSIEEAAPEHADTGGRIPVAATVGLSPGE